MNWNMSHFQIFHDRLCCHKYTVQNQYKKKVLLESLDTQNQKLSFKISIKISEISIE